MPITFADCENIVGSLRHSEQTTYRRIYEVKQAITEGRRYKSRDRTEVVAVHRRQQCVGRVGH